MINLEKLFMGKSKFSLFIENFLVYGLSGIISKAIPLLMLPIITRLFPSAEYFGLFDLSNILINIGSAIVIMGMYDGMFRLFFEKSDYKYKKEVCSTTFVFTLVSSLVVFFLMVLFKSQLSELFFYDKKYINLVYISAFVVLVSGTNGIISAPTRMQNKRMVFVITNAVSPIIGYLISIPLILNGHYVIALPLSMLISSFVIELSFLYLNSQWFSFRFFNIKLLKKIMLIGIPLFPNFVVYWIFNSCDRIMITNILGIEQSGIYAVGAKLGMVSQLIYVAFAGGWQYFAFSTMDDKNQVKNNSLIFEYLSAISFVTTIIVCCFSELIFKIVFPKEYHSGYIVSPYLFLSPLLLMLYQVIANQFLVIKKTWPSFFILVFGALANILLNLYLIPILGIEGASISTVLGYAITVLICVIVLSKMALFKVSIRMIYSLIFFVMCFVAWRICFSDNLVYSSFLALFFLLLCIFLYRAMCLTILTSLLKR